MTDFQLDDPKNKAELLQSLALGWTTLRTFLGILTPAQMTEPRDAAGWNVKDHLVHIYVWQNGVCALVEGKGESRIAAMGVDAETWAQDIDAINAFIQRQHADVPPETVLARLEAAYQRMQRAIEALPEEALHFPYRHYDPSRDRDEPIMGWLFGDGSGHYIEHLPWIQAIAAQG